MTREETIGFLDKCRWWFEPYTSEEEKLGEAIDMAIEALSAEPSGDLISRQAAIDAIRQTKNNSDMPYYWNRGMEMAMEVIEDAASLPSADAVEVVRCKDCAHNNDCDIQYSAQAGDNFFCGFGETKEDVRKDGRI